MPERDYAVAILLGFIVGALVWLCEMAAVTGLVIFGAWRIPFWYTLLIPGLSWLVVTILLLILGEGLQGV